MPQKVRWLFGVNSLGTRYLRQPTVVHYPLRAEEYNQTVAHFTTNRIEGGILLKCTRCEYSVSTLDFNAGDGNLRTQGATAINRHATEVHHQPTMYSSLDPQRRIWQA